MNLFQRTLSFIARNRNNLLYVLGYAYAFPQRVFTNNAVFLTGKKLTEELEKGKSLIRFGDGEIYMMNYGSIPQYEPYNPNLRKYFFKMIKEYSVSSPYIIGIPVFVNYSNQDLKRIGKFDVWLPLKVLYRFVFPHNVPYFDAHAFYRYKGFDNTLAGILEKYKILVVTRAYNISLMKEAGMQERLDVEFIETPERETFQHVPQLLKTIDAKVGEKKDQYRVLLACGPASKVLAYELSKRGIVSYDIGKGIETVYRKNEIEQYI